MGGGELHSEELHDSYTSPNIIWVITLGMMRCLGHYGNCEEKEALIQEFGVET